MLYKLVLESPCSTKSVPAEVNIQVLTDIREKSISQALAFKKINLAHHLFSKHKCFSKKENLSLCNKIFLLEAAKDQDRILFYALICIEQSLKATARNSKASTEFISPRQ